MNKTVYMTCFFTGILGIIAFTPCLAQRTFQQKLRVGTAFGTHFSVSSDAIPQADDGMIVSIGGVGLTIANLDSNLQPIWEKTILGSLTPHVPKNHDILLPTGGGFIISGKHMDYQNDDYSSFDLMKFNTQGDTLWTRSYRYADTSIAGGAEPDYWASALGADGSIFVAIATSLNNVQHEKRIHIFKTDAAGGWLWSKKYDVHLGSGEVSGITEMADGSLMLLANTQISGIGYSTLVMKTDAQGNPSWTKTLTTPTTRGFFVQSRTDALGNWYMTGLDETSVPSTAAGIAARLDGSGNVIWSKQYNHAGNSHSAFTNFAFLPDGNLLALGLVSDNPFNDFDQDLSLSWIDTLGNVSRNVMYRQPGMEQGISLRPASAGRWLIGGVSSWATIDTISAHYLMVNSQGGTSCGHDTLLTLNAAPLTLTVLNVTVTASNLPVQPDSLLNWVFPTIMLDSVVCAPGTGLAVTSIPADAVYSIYPNPAHQHLTVIAPQASGKTDLLIYDLSGKRVLMQPLKAGNNTASLSGLLPGHYFVLVNDDNGNSFRQHLVVE